MTAARQLALTARAHLEVPIGCLTACLTAWLRSRLTSSTSEWAPAVRSRSQVACPVAVPC